MTEVPSFLLSTQPYACIGTIEVEWANGTFTRGTCTLVGRNDILTAGHVVYDPDRGGWAKDVSFHFGADYNAVTGVFEREGVVPDFSRWRMLAWPEPTFSQGGNTTMSRWESQFDVALIGIDIPLGDTLGWMGLDPGQNGRPAAQAVGYPAGSTGMMQEFVTVSRPAGVDVYESAYDVMGPGSSGGPLLVGSYVIGVKSTATWWADLGGSTIYDELLEHMTSNNDLLPAAPADTRPPAFVGWWHEGGVTGVAWGANLELRFDEPIRLGTGRVVLRDQAGAVVESFSATGGGLAVQGQVLVINPTRDLAVFSRYTVEVAPGVVLDAAGNPFTGLDGYPFQTRGLEGLYHFFLVAFDAAPGVEYMDQMAQAYNGGASLRQIVNVFTTKVQFTSVYPTAMGDEQFADKMVAAIVGASASAAARREAVVDIDQALGLGWSRGDVVYQVFGNLAAKPLSDGTWGNTARQFQNQAAVARYFTEDMQYAGTDLPTLRAVVAGVDYLSDTSSPDSIAKLIGVALEGLL